MRMKMSKPLTFQVSKTYSEITPESVDHGDFDDTGFVWADVEYTFRELVEELSSGEWCEDLGSTDWFSNGWDIIDYRELREREECLHIKRPTSRHERYYQLALRLAGVN